MTTPTMHPFEEAGLGAAPFRCVGVSRRVGPITLENGTQVGAPGQPMGSCAYCGTGIADCYHIRSADGKRFVVGCDCVLKISRKDNVKSGAKTDLERDVLRERRRLEADKRAEKRNAKWERDMIRVRAGIAILEGNIGVRDLLAAQPSPNEYRATQLRETRLDWATWMMHNAGMTSRLEIVRELERHQAAISAEIDADEAREAEQQERTQADR